METRKVENHTFRNRDFLSNLYEGYKKKLNLGCGPDYRKGWTNLDADAFVKSDVCVVLGEEELPFRDNEFDLILASHVLEHISNLVAAKREIARILRPEGRLVILVPHYLSPDAWGDDTHCRAFSVYSFLQTYWPEYDGSKGHHQLIKATFEESGEEMTWILVILHKKNV